MTAENTTANAATKDKVTNMVKRIPQTFRHQSAWTCAAAARCTVIAAVTVAMLWTSAARAAPAADLWPVWQADNPDSTQQIDHNRWQQFLNTFLTISDDGINRLAYSQVDNSGSALLDNYINMLTATDPRTLHKDEQLPYWINLYNALTVQVVLRYPDKGSILRMGEKFFAIGPWDDEVTSIAGHTITLNDIEHRILRPIWQDHRIHFAVNCASIGCPNLSAQAFTRSNTPQLLAAAQQQYIHHPRGVSLPANGDAKGNISSKLTLSSIFDWYQSDFAANERDLLVYLSQHHPLAEQLANYQGRIKYDYDWSLNTVAE